MKLFISILFSLKSEDYKLLFKKYLITITYGITLKNVWKLEVLNQF